MKVIRYSAGSYGWKNGIRIEHTGKTWTVYQYGVSKFVAMTLGACKYYLYMRYKDSFTF